MSSKAEQAFQDQVIKIAHLYGWKHYHTYDSRRCVKGFPDLVLVKKGIVIFAELKSEKGRLTPEQKEWIEALRKAEWGAVCVYVWRPSQLQEIADQLGKEIID